MCAYGQINSVYTPLRVSCLTCKMVDSVRISKTRYRIIYWGGLAEQPSREERCDAVIPGFLGRKVMSPRLMDRGEETLMDGPEWLLPSLWHCENLLDFMETVQMLELGGEFGKSSARGNRWHQKSSQRSHCAMLSFDSADAIMPAPKDEGICHRSASFSKE